MPPDALPWLTPSGTLAERIAAALAHEICEGSVDPGELLTEVEVAARHGASRTPVREAMLKLEAWGLVRLAPKKGALVTSPTERERRELLSVRSMLEGHAVARIVADETVRTSLLEQLDPLLAAQADALADPARFALLDHSFHLRIALHDENRVVEEILRSLAPRLYRLTHLAVSAPGADRAGLRQEHVELAAAVHRRDVAAFRELIDHHLLDNHGRYEVMP